jgi:hypothetical protein
VAAAFVDSEEQPSLRKRPAAGKAAAKQPKRSAGFTVADKDDPSTKIVNCLLGTLTPAQKNTLIQNIKVLGTLFVASACSGSNVTTMMITMIFSVLGVGSLVDLYVCESVDVLFFIALVIAPLHKLVGRRSALVTHLP